MKEVQISSFSHQTYTRKWANYIGGDCANSLNGDTKRLINKMRKLHHDIKLMAYQMNL